MSGSGGEKANSETDNLDRRRRVELHPIWWALVLILLGAAGMWQIYTGLEERVARIAKENTKFPPNAIVAFSGGPGACPDKWHEATELQGRFIVGAGKGPELLPRPYGQPGGLETATIQSENLPPHRHQVYRHAGEIIGVSSGINGAGGEDTNATSRVREVFLGPELTLTIAHF